MDDNHTNECSVCRGKEVEQLKRELTECRRRGQNKDKKIKELDKKNFILMLIAIGIGAILGKEVLDSIAEWLDSIGSFRGSVEGVVLDLPSPGALPLLAFAMIPGVGLPTRRRRGG